MTDPLDVADLPVVTICKQKIHGGRGCWQAYQVRRDDDGLWLFTPAGSVFRSGEGPTDDDRCEVEGGSVPGLDSLVLVPDDSQFWMACWRVPERPLHISVEICGWVRREPGLVAFQDWELDPFRLRSGTVAVEDLDDFVEARATGQLSADLAEQALTAAARIERSLRRRTAPFDDRGDELLASCGRLGLAPLVEVPHPFEL